MLKFYTFEETHYASKRVYLHSNNAHIMIEDLRVLGSGVGSSISILIDKWEAIKEFIDAQLADQHGVENY
jgi:hypothetical protein